MPRTEVDFLDAGTPVFKAIKDTAKMPHSRYPVIRGSADDVVGFRPRARPLRPGPVRHVGPGRRAGPAGVDAAGTNRVLTSLQEMRRGVSTWRSSSTSTAAPPASSPWRTSSRSSSVTSVTSTTSISRRRPGSVSRRGRRPAQPRGLPGRDRGRAARGSVRDGGRLHRAARSGDSQRRVTR